MQTGTIRTGVRVNGETVHRPTRLPHLKERMAGRDVVIYDPRRGRMHVLNVTAAFIWRQCDGTRSQDDMLRNLEAEFGLEGGEHAEEDVTRVLRLFLEEALIVDSAAPRSGSSADRTQSGDGPPVSGGESK